MQIPITKAPIDKNKKARKKLQEITTPALTPRYRSTRYPCKFLKRPQTRQRRKMRKLYYKVGFPRSVWGISKRASRLTEHLMECKKKAVKQRKIETSSKETIRKACIGCGASPSSSFFYILRITLSKRFSTSAILQVIQRYSYPMNRSFQKFSKNIACCSIDVCAALPPSSDRLLSFESSPLRFPVPSNRTVINWQFKVSFWPVQKWALTLLPVLALPPHRDQPGKPMVPKLSSAGFRYAPSVWPSQRSPP